VPAQQPNSEIGESGTGKRRDRAIRRKPDDEGEHQAAASSAAIVFGPGSPSTTKPCMPWNDFTALLDRLTHHCHIVERSNYRWRFKNRA
jgi:hypothetical protein